MSTPNTPSKQGKSRTETVLERFHEESKLEATYDIRSLRNLYPFVRPHAHHLFLSLGLLVVGALLALARPLVMRAGFDGLDGPNALDVMTLAAAQFTALIVGEQLLAFPQMYAMQLAGARAMADLRRHVFRFLHSAQLGFFDRTPVGRLVTRVTNDVDAIGEMFASGALNAVGDLVRLLAIVIIMLVARLAAGAHRLRRGVRPWPWGELDAPPDPRRLPGDPREDGAHERVPERAGLGHGRRAGLRPRGAARPPSSTRSTSPTATPTTAPSSTTRPSTPRSR
jgi:hypothetical protein